MSNKTTIESQNFNCEKCEQQVTFRLRVLHFGNDETDSYASTVDRILDYGKCALAAQAKIPGHPLHSDVEGCPVYKNLK